MNKKTYAAYVQILKDELILALGCTEPIAIALAAAKGREVLDGEPEKVEVFCSGNIIKNVQGVFVPNSGGMKGIEAAAALGIFGGKSEKLLEVLTGVSEAEIEKAKNFIAQKHVAVHILETPAKLHVRVLLSRGEETVLTEIRDRHANIIRVEKNGATLFSKEETEQAAVSGADKALLNIRDIIVFANEVDIADVREVIEHQIIYNSQISAEGLTHKYGANIGQNLLKYYGDDIKTRARAAAAAGSDARMGGCVFPVVINSGSGNQGITVSVPVIEYAKYLQVPHEKLIRALVCSNLVAIHQKTKIGVLSAYCGAVSAACGSGAGITYLFGGSAEQICKTITNTLANVSGIICDGAKASCAAKIASAIDAAIMAHCLATENEVFQTGDGIIKDDIEQTIGSVGKLAAEGMKSTDETILKIMVE